MVKLVIHIGNHPKGLVSVTTVAIWISDIMRSNLSHNLALTLCASRLYLGGRFFARFKNSVGTKGPIWRWRKERKEKDEARPGQDTV